MTKYYDIIVDGPKGGSVSGDVQERAKEYIFSKYGNPVKRGSVSSIDDVYEAYLAGHAGASDMKGEVEALKAENERLRKDIRTVLVMLEERRQKVSGLGMPVSILKTALTNSVNNKPQQ